MSDESMVWAVESGGYDDYHVEALFATEELAQQFCSAMNYGRPRWHDARKAVAMPVLQQLPKFVDVLTIAAGSPAGWKPAEWHDVYPETDTSYQTWVSQPCDVERDPWSLYVCGSDHDEVRATFAREYRKWLAEMPPEEAQA